MDGNYCFLCSFAVIFTVTEHLARGWAGITPDRKRREIKDVPVTVFVQGTVSLCQSPSFHNKQLFRFEKLKQISQFKRG